MNKTTEALNLKEVNRRIDWLVNNMPFAPPRWATNALAELIEQKKALAEPVKQEPVKMMNSVGNTEAYLPGQQTSGFDIPLYAAPVDAKAIREALANARAEALAEPVSPADIKLPVDVTIGCGTIKAGCSLQTLLKRIEVINKTWVPKIQSALQHKRGCNYERIDQDQSECTCGVTEIREVLADHSGDANEMVAEPVKQEPVADKVLRLLEPFMPVDAKVIRAEALEEAAKVCDEEAKAWARLNAQDEEGFGAIQCAAAIRGLK